MAAMTVQAPATEEFLQLARRVLPHARHDRLERAYRVAQECYDDRQHDFLAMTLMEQAEGIARLALEFCPDEDAIIAALLHKVLILQTMTLEELQEQFGPDVKSIVSALHLLAHLTTDDPRRSIDDLRIMLVSVSDDVRVVLLALCRRCFCVEHLSAVPDKKVRLRLCREALQLFAPVASRLGIYSLKHRLEHAAFAIVYPIEAENIALQLTELHTRHGAFLDHVVRAVERYLASQGIVATVQSREKHPYSIFLKQRAKGSTDVVKIHDLFALRVIVEKEADCYQTLGMLHRFAVPVSHRFKDYISFPKPNGYQSLHTCLMRVPDGPPDLMFEVQIRTRRMHEEAEYGVAAHWSYKEGKTHAASRRTQLKDVLQRQQLYAGADDAEGQMRVRATDDDGSLVDHIYVLTPRGDIIELSDDATPLDFAFTIHTDLGLAFRAARVNGVVVPISHKLENGDVVEILTTKHPRPSPNWMDEVRTSSARHKLRSYFATKDRDQHLAHGRELVNIELRMRHLPPLDTDITLLKKYNGRDLSLREREEVLIKVGKGGERPGSVLKHLGIGAVPQARRSLTAERASRREHIVEVAGGLTMPLRFAKCCSPNATTYESPIVGFVTRRGEITVHRASCGMLRNANAERFVEVHWAN